MPLPAWLPAIISFGSYEGDWDKYLAAVYDGFKQDLVNVSLVFQGRRVGLKRHPVELGKEATFWHLISEGKTEADRIPDIRRCERIRWTRAIIDNCNDPSLKFWTEVVRGDTRIHVWCEDAEYLVVLADRGSYVLPWTAYPVTQDHRKKKLLARWKNATATK